MAGNSLEKRLQEMEIRGRIEIIQTTVWLKMARQQKIVLETLGNFPSLRLLWKIRKE